MAYAKLKEIFFVKIFITNIWFLNYLLFVNYLLVIESNWDLKIVAVVDRWSLLGGGRWLRFDCIYKKNDSVKTV